MTVIAGLALGVGLLLVVSPGLWPRAQDARLTRRAPRVRDRLAQAGLHDVNPAIVVAVSVLLGVVAAATILALTGVLVLGVAAGVLAAVAPTLVLAWRARLRRAATRAVWPDLVDQLVSSVRAGSSLPDSLSALATVGPEVTRTEFAAFAATYRTTGNLGVCLDELKVRLADPVADRTSSRRCGCRGRSAAPS